MKIEFEIREIFLPLWEQKARYGILMGGRGRGASTAVSQYIISQMPTKKYFRCALMRAVHSDIRHSSWRELQDRIDEQNAREVFHITDNEMRLRLGTNVVQAHGFRQSSGSNTAKLKSLASYNVVWIEEAEEISEEEFRTLDDTLRTIKGDIFIILSVNPPHKNHWIVRKWFDLDPANEGFFKPKLKEDSDAVFVGGTFEDNVQNLDENTIARYQNYKTTNPSYYWQMIAGLVPEVLRGKIYSGWRQVEEIPFNARLVRYGLDFGWFPDPTHLVAIYDYEGGYILDEMVHGNYIQNESIATAIRNRDKNVLCVADNEEKSINEIRGYGVNIIAAEKGKDSVAFRIKTINALKISVTARSKNLWEAYENYAWRETKDGDPTGEPNHLWSHPMDAAGYGILSLPTIQQKDEAKRNHAIWAQQKITNPQTNPV